MEKLEEDEEVPVLKRDDRLMLIIATCEIVRPMPLTFGDAPELPLLPENNVCLKRPVLVTGLGEFEVGEISFGARSEKCSSE